MAKRKRLTPLNDSIPLSKSSPLSDTTIGKSSTGVLRARAHAPIADVAFDAANTAAMTEIVDTLQSAQTKGRMIVPLPLDQIIGDYLVRDRLAVDSDEMDALVASIRVRGQQSPIDVVSIGTNAAPRYGLISGWRRLQALQYLASETEDPQFRTILALQRTPTDAAETYLAMVEENEIRVGLSYYERARITAKAVEQKVYATEKLALNGLFGSVSRAKRSKIKTFMRIVETLDDVLLFPSAIAERIGLTLGRTLQLHPDLVMQLRAQLVDAPPQSAEEELEILKRIAEPENERSPQADKSGDSIKLQNPKTDTGSRIAVREALGPGLHAQSHADGRLTLGGSALTPDLRNRLTTWLAQQLTGE